MADDDQEHLADLVSTVLDAQPDAQPAPAEQAQPQAPQYEQMSDDTLKAIIAEKLGTSSQWYGSSAQVKQRIDADKYYLGEPLGTEQGGRSQIVSRDVAEAIDSMLPSLLRIFASGEEVVKMEPNGPEDEAAAKQATDYLNYLFLEKNEGFTILHTWFKDALGKRVGTVKCWFEKRTNRKKEYYEGLTQPELAMLQANPEFQVTVTSQEVATIEQPGPDGVPVPQQIPTFCCNVIRSKPEKKTRIANVPPDEFIIESMAISEEDVSFIGQKWVRTVSDLVELGFPVEDMRQLAGGVEMSQERMERFKDEDASWTDTSVLDKSQKLISGYELYLKTDYDGDGIAEWRKVVLAGENKLLSNEEVDDHPYSSITPIPMPHKFIGRSITDQTCDIQEIKTALIRGALDSIYLANSPRLGVVDGQVNIDDVLDTRVGGVVRMKNPQAIVPIPTVMAAPQAFQMIEYIDAVRENRTGVSRYNQGLDADSLNKTATGINIIANASQQRQELIARIFAETGVKRLFRRLFQLTCMHQDVPQTVRLRGKWVEVNPRDWADKMDVSVSVGIGMGNKQQQLQTMIGLLNIDQQIVTLQGGVNGPILTAENIYNKLVKVAEAAGLKTPEPYYTDPKTVPAQPPKPDPVMMKAQADMQIKQVELQMKQLDLRIKEVESSVKIHEINAGPKQDQSGQSMQGPAGQPGIQAGA